MTSRIPGSPIQPSSHEKKSTGPEGKSKEFKLPERKDEKTEARQREKPKKEEEDEEKKEEKVASAQFEKTPFQTYGQLSESNVGQTQAISAVEMKKAIDQISAIVQKMVNKMYVGEVEGKAAVTMEFKASEVPSFLAGANMTIVDKGEGKITITFSNMTTQNVNVALQVIRQGEPQLMKLAETLSTRNIILSEIQVGNQVISIAPPSISPSIFAGTEGFKERGEGQGGGGGGGEPGEEKEERKKR